MKLYSLVNLKNSRKKAGFKTQSALAEKMGVNLKTVMNWEQGISVPELETICQLAEVLNVSIDYLLGRIECTTHDTQYIHDKIGLSEGCIKNLEEWNTSEDIRRQYWPEYISRILTDEKTTRIMSLLNEYLGFSKLIALAMETCPSEIPDWNDIQAAKMLYMNHYFDDILEEMRLEYRQQKDTTLTEGE